MQKGLVSVVIPCFNGALDVLETINSVLDQPYQNIEIVFIDDGSTDTTRQIVEQINTDKLTYHFQKNKGVSAARNKGFRNSKGEFVLFLDADDKLDSSFLHSRIKLLTENNNIDFVTGFIQSFGASNTLLKGALNLEQDILSYDLNISSCPSNYLYRKQSLLGSNIVFNEKLSSTADKFFLLRCGRKFVGAFDENENAKLLYRVNPKSMSNSLGVNLVKDNEKYFNETIKLVVSDQKLMKLFKQKTAYFLAAGFFKVKLYWKSLKWLFKYLTFSL